MERINLQNFVQLVYIKLKGKEFHKFYIYELILVAVEKVNTDFKFW